jgi:hypothetical protein
LRLVRRWLVVELLRQAVPATALVEATGGLHRAWVSELERRWPDRCGCLPLRDPGGQDPGRLAALQD